ncbi:beta-glucosidase 17 isoform X3 [Senna tora]|uniref:Beta-glucosidase 17 isoform X3 n=1 Tax=Senna tora TaxID=362788 RepID=A0A834X1M4_9FABA|nr:beta-glucosidase 17 isoform X3 [Senna tora]
MHRRRMVWAKQLVLLLLALSSTSLFEFVASLNGTIFPPDFVFGTTSSSYQEQHMKEGRAQAYGILSPIDFQEDVGIMKDIGFNAYRFSISWPRILPKGNLKGGLNPEGIQYYNNLIDELISNGLQPFVTLFHWDLPQALEDEYGGFLSPKIVKDFAQYAEVCFGEYGDRVKHWITFNEPMGYSYMGYANGLFPPGRCSNFLGLNCSAGDSSTEPYLVSHYQILAHAEAVKVYREKYQASQKGQIGITLNSIWSIPLSQSNADKDAASRGIAFMYDWNGVLLGPKAASDWLCIYPPGIQYLLQYTKEKYNNPIIYITENGVDELNDGTKSLDDKIRIDYISHHLLYVQRAMRNGVKVKGYFTWSLLDNFEWINGYTVRFGIVYVDFKDGLKRYHKRSALWFKHFLKQRNGQN